MYRSMGVTGAVGTDRACAESGLVSWLEVASLGWRCVLKVRIAGLGRLSELCRECGNSTGRHEVGVM